MINVYIALGIALIFFSVFAAGMWFARMTDRCFRKARDAAAEWDRIEVRGEQK